jgi:glutamate/tyrosine decarboxylase-like PLP-dependent enzyme
MEENMTQASNGDIFGDIERSIKPYRQDFPTFSRLPQKGRAKQEVIDLMNSLYAREEPRWKDGYVSGAVYHGDENHIDFLNTIYAVNSQSNPLHSDLWPSTTKFEAEVVAMTAHMLNAMIVPTTAHAAFDKAAQYFNIKIIRIPVGADFKADVTRTEEALTDNTIVLVGSAPAFPHGTIDPIEQLSELARKNNIGFHTDACLGGFILPWATKLGYPIPPFDFRLPGVTSISIDTHKYGYAAKGSSVILYRNPNLRNYQFYTITDWPGGLYFSPTFAGSRPGALIATAWAAMVAIGEQGYIQIAERILETGDKIKHGIMEIPELYILGDPLWDIAFSSKTLDIYKIMDYMTERNWNLNGLQHPAAVHICLTHRHTQPGLADKFIADLKIAVQQVAQNPDQETAGMGRLYGLAAQIPDKAMVDGFLRAYIDMLYKV